MAAKSESGLGPEYTYDLTELRKVDPALVRFMEGAPVPTGMAQPRGIAVGPDDRLWVVGDTNIRTLGGPAGLNAVAMKAGGEPQCLAIGKDGKLYVAMGNHVEVRELGKDPVLWAAADPKSVLTGIAATDKDIFVADAQLGAVLRYDLAGKLLGRIGEANEARNIPGILIPSPYFDVAIGPDGLLWATNPGRRRVECYSPDGDLKSWWGRASARIEGFCGCCNPTYLAVMADGSFVTSEKGLPRVKVYAKTGDLDCVVAPPSAFDQAAVGLDVAADSKGRVYVLDPLARTVRVFERKKPAVEGKS
jgi:hypothetical protein